MTPTSRLAADRPTSSPGSSPARPARSRPAAASVGPECARRPELFLNSLLEQPPAAGAPIAVRNRASDLAAEAVRVCDHCPLLTECLYRAVVTYDVAGFVAGTTERQRDAIRARLGVHVQPEDFDTMAGVSGGHRQIDHDEVVRLRRAHPDESLERLAGRLGCSLSTVKRHLRRERRNPTQPSAPTARPTTAAVRSATAIVLGRVLGRTERPRAA